MRNVFINALAAIALVGTLASKVLANDAHHSTEKKEAAKSESMGAGDPSAMMGKMDKGQMMSMMHKCLEMHQDGKMCEHQTMEKCQSQMDPSECRKMMKNSRKASKDQ